ncbi:MAG: SpoIIE family protein phosphatase [Pseudomonadota bacterium]
MSDPIDDSVQIPTADVRPLTPGERGGLSVRDLSTILEVTRALAAPFDLTTMLTEVTGAARQVLQAERSSVWLFDAAAAELVLKVSSDISDVRIPIGAGLVGACARDRTVINVPDCYADPRFNAETDRRSGFRTRCALTLPLVDHEDGLVGVMQVLNRSGGVFDAEDEALAAALAAQCAVALQRVRMTEALIEGEKMRAELDMARIVQRSTLPGTMPALAGYEAFGASQPAEQTGGDTFDLSLVDGQLLVVLGDATGHGIAPALSVTQMHAMLRMAFRLGADIETAYGQVNDQLADTLPDDRFITAFIGLLDPATHRLRFISAGQGPILHYQAASGSFARYPPTSFPLGAMHLPAPRAASTLEMQPGDVLLLLSDGIYEQHESGGEMFGEQRVERILLEHRDGPLADLSVRLLAAVQAFAAGVPQEDDITLVLLRRQAGSWRTFPPRLEALGALVAFTADAFERGGIDRRLLTTVDFVLEELFTNVVKYGLGTSQAPVTVRVELQAIAGGVAGSLTADGVADFDVTRAPQRDTSLPIEERQPGGLGLQLIGQLVDSVRYEYDVSQMRSRVTFRKTLA